MKLYIFNPDTEMALADNTENYMAPATVRRMIQDLALLPIWYASPDSGVLAPSAYNQDFLKQMQQLFPLPVQLVTEPELPQYADAEINPWGWNRAVRRRLIKGGIPSDKLPSDIELEMHRSLASRASIVELYNAFRHYARMNYVCGYFRLIEGDGREPITNAFLQGFDNTCVFKSLWSSSGKGLCWCRNGLTKTAVEWCRKEMSKYGGVVAEPIYTKKKDFAMEFYSDGKGNVFFVGYSWFITNEKGAYCSSILCSDEEVERSIQHYIPLKDFLSIRESMLESLEEIYGESYTGYFGVDMMVCRDFGEHPYLIHPLVEVNLRMNMGVVARMLHDKFVAPGKTGEFFIDNYRTNEELRVQHERDIDRYPLVVEDGRVVSGYLPLVPVTPKSRFRAYIRIAQS